MGDLIIYPFVLMIFFAIYIILKKNLIIKCLMCFL